MFLTVHSMALVMQIFTPNYFATTVIDNCGLLPERAFSSNWIELEFVEKKGMLLFMTRTVRPLVICAGSLFQMNTNTFLKVLLVHPNMDQIDPNKIHVAVAFSF